MKSLKVVVSVLAIALLMVSTIAYFLNLPLSGYILWFAVPLCIIAVYLSLKPKKNAKITPILMLMLAMFSFGSVPKAFANIYQRYGNVGWIYPDGEAWAMVDTGADQLCFKWSFSQYIILPYIGVWFPIGYVEIYDSHGTIYFRDGKSETIPTSEELWLSYSGENVWITFKIQACYILASPVPAFLTPEISLTFYIGDPPSDGGGGCPYVYTWAGQQYVMDNNLLPASEMSNGVDVEDRYMLEQPLFPSHQGTAFSLYSLQIREFEHEHDFIDQVKVVALDHASDVKIAVTPKGEILTYRQPLAPLSCIDNDGTSRLNEVVSMDGNVSDTTTYFEGYPGDYLILNFGKVDAENAKLILRDDMKCMEVCIEVQVPSQTGDWQTVEVLNPRNYWAIEAVDLSEYVVEDEDLLVRLYWTSPHRLDYVGLDTTPQDIFELHYATLISAIHSSEGNVRRRLLENDQTYAELTPGQQIQLTFQLPNNRNEERTFILYTEGHYSTIAP